jgi:hypothetical protein
MRTWLVAAVAVGVLLVAGPPVLALVQATDEIGATRTGSAPAQPVLRDGQEHGQDQEQDQGQGWRKHHRDGPPPWASHPRGPQAQVGGWHDLTPKQRALKMARLAQRHATAMRKWAACRQAGRTDCVRPLPPGLAKRLR